MATARSLPLTITGKSRATEVANRRRLKRPLFHLRTIANLPSSLHWHLATTPPFYEVRITRLVSVWSKLTTCNRNPGALVLRHALTRVDLGAQERFVRLSLPVPPSKSPASRVRLTSPPPRETRSQAR